MKDLQENSLANSSSSYLRSARHQPVQWHEWGPEAFARAQQEAKPILLDIGAVWCHWCHVMDRESYENEETAALINEKFIAVKVDRDERPDIDTRYQSAVSTISGQGGWPLTAFLAPDGKPFFGGTYFPPDERYGRPSFRRVLQMMANAFEHKRDEVNETASSVLEAIAHNETISGTADKPLHSVLNELLGSTLSQVDTRNGGFGSQPKFPHYGAIDLLIDAVSRGGDQAAVAAHSASETLRKMADGGIYDQLAGGFHRYSVDERWIVPHFEKMAYDNSELLKNYVHAFQTFLDPKFANVARGIIGWMDAWLSDRERGGFYASQDADDSLDDDGDYFTWTRAEAKSALSPEEFAAAAAYFNLRDVGDMHHNPQKNVLHVRPGAEAGPLIASAKAKMYAARLERPTPFVDRTVYSGWNGMCISGYLEAARVLNMPEAQAFALKSLDRVLAEAWSEQNGLAHVVGYGETAEPAKLVKGLLEDYAFVANSALDAWESTGELRYFVAGRDLADAMISRFYDSTDHGFFDTELDVDGIGVLSVRRKPLQDAPMPAGNAVAATVLLRLAELTQQNRYRELASDTLEAYSGVVERLGLHGASFGLALRRLVEAPVQVCVVGEGESAQALMAAALTGYSVSKNVIRLRRDQLSALPPALAETLPHLSHSEAAIAIVCRDGSCLPPVEDADKLAELLS